MASDTRFYGTGRRKTSVARVWLKPGGGSILVNRRAFEDYFPRETLRMIICQPLQVTNTLGQFDATDQRGRRRADRPGGRGAARHRARARCSSTTSSARRSRRPGSSRAIRACGSARSTASRARGQKFQYSKR